MRRGGGPRELEASWLFRPPFQDAHKGFFIGRGGAMAVEGLGFGGRRPAMGSGVNWEWIAAGRPPTPFINTAS